MAEGEPAKRDASFVGSFAKGLRVITVFGREREALTVSEVAELADLDRAGARRFLRTLVALGYATTDGKRFRLTPRVLELGFAFLSSLSIDELARPLLARVSAKLSESSSMSMLDDLEIVYVARVATSRIMSVRLGVGARLPAVSTSMGRVLLAHLSPRDLDARLQRAELVRHTPHTITTKRDLKKELRRVREQGYAIVDQELEQGLRSLAVPVVDRDGGVRTAINVSTQAARTPKAEVLKRLLPVVRAASEELSGLSS